MLTSKEERVAFLAARTGVLFDTSGRAHAGAARHEVCDSWDMESLLPVHVARLQGGCCEADALRHTAGSTTHALMQTSSDVTEEAICNRTDGKVGASSSADAQWSGSFPLKTDGMDA